MKPSRFLLFIPHNNDEYILLHTLNGAILVVDNELKEYIQKFPNKIPSETLEVLRKQGIIIDDEVDELSVYKYYLNKLKYQSHTARFLIVTTYDCNFACVYCYEKEARAKIYMNLDTANRVANHIKDFSKAQGVREVRIGLYGGEPLLNIKPAIVILEEVLKWAEEENIVLKTDITTNGSLLTRDIAKKLAEYNITSTQVTIDGPREIHNRLRPFKNGEGSFDVIITNIINCVDYMNIDIAVNLCKDNYRYVPMLLDYLADMGLKDKITLWWNTVVGPDPCQKRLQLSDEELAKAYYNLSLETLKRGFKLGIRKIAGIYLCDAMRETSQIIDPEGFIYKCWGLIGNKKFIVGKVGERTLRPLYFKWMTRDALENPTCRECPKLPICNGGCYYENFIKKGSIYAPYCGVAHAAKLLEVATKLYIFHKYGE